MEYKTVAPRATLGPVAQTDKGLLTEVEAARYLGLSPSLLRKLRWLRSGVGPPFRRLAGCVIRYSRAELEAWIASQPTEAGRRAKRSRPTGGGQQPQGKGQGVSLSGPETRPTGGHQAAGAR